MEITGVKTSEEALYDRRLKQACADFEAIFIRYILKTMRNTVLKSGLLKSPLGNDIYELIMDQKVAERMAKERGIGLAKSLYQQLKKVYTTKGSKVDQRL